jgi:hypothetical protein
VRVGLKTAFRDEENQLGLAMRREERAIDQGQLNGDPFAQGFRDQRGHKVARSSPTARLGKKLPVNDARLIACSPLIPDGGGQPLERRETAPDPQSDGYQCRASRGYLQCWSDIGRMLPVQVRLPIVRINFINSMSKESPVESEAID